MFENKNYKRFKKIYDYITDEKCYYTKEFEGNFYKYKTFHTKLGDRSVIGHLRDKTIYIAYHDYDNSLLFVLAIERNGEVRIVQNIIDELAIFSAIYELECLIYNDKEEQKGKLLNKLLSYYSPNSYGTSFWHGKVK